MHDVEHDHARVGRDVVLLQLAAARVPAEDVHLDQPLVVTRERDSLVAIESLLARLSHVPTATFALGFSSPSKARRSAGASGSGAVRRSIAPPRTRVTTFFFPHSG